MRRSSVVGPLLLIAIGLLFLARNIFPDLRLVDYLALYWPYLLIAWGGLRLVEIGIWTSQGKALPRQGVSGGEWGLVVFLCFLGLTIHAVRGVSTWLPRAGLTVGGLDIFGESYDYPVSGEKATSKTPRLVIAPFRGNARITGADVDSIKVSGHTTIRTLDQASADRHNQAAPFELAGDANQVTIRTNQDRVTGTARPTADLEITVPRGASLELHGRFGDFDVIGVNGTVEIDSDNAGVRLENLEGPVRVNLRRSDVIRAMNLKSSIEIKGRGKDVDLENIEGQVTVDGSYSGITQFRKLARPVRFVSPFSEVTAERVPGSIRISIGDLTGSGLAGPVRITSTRSKDVDLSDFSGALDIDLAGGDIQLAPPLLVPKMNVRTRRGDIELSLPAAAKVDLTATTEQGDMENDFGAPFTQAESRRGWTLRGSNGGSAVSLETNRGDVRLRKSAVAGTPPAAPLRPLNQ